MDIETYIARKSGGLQRVPAESDLTDDERLQIWRLNDPKVERLELHGEADGALKSSRMEAESAPTWHRAASVEVHPVTSDRWGDLVDLFERTGPRGGLPIPGSCWCVYWQGGRQAGRTQHKADMKAWIDADHVPGLLAYLDTRPVGWVAVAPRKVLVRLERSRQYGPCPGDQDVFAITCFYVDRSVRGQGISSMLLEAAIEYARGSGAAAVDAFPKIDVAAHAVGNRRAEENYSYIGRRGQYQARGFTTIRESGKRAVMRLTLVGDCG